MIPGLKLFNSEMYWECHEYLEDLWREETADVRFVYWAIIQVASALLHFKNQNKIGAFGLLKKSKEKFLKVSVNKLLEEKLQWSILKEIVFQIEFDEKKNDQTLSVFNHLYEFKFRIDEV